MRRAWKHCVLQVRKSNCRYEKIGCMLLFSFPSPLIWVYNKYILSMLHSGVSWPVERHVVVDNWINKLRKTYLILSSIYQWHSTACGSNASQRHIRSNRHGNTEIVCIALPLTGKFCEDVTKIHDACATNDMGAFLLFACRACFYWTRNATSWWIFLSCSRTMPISRRVIIADAVQLWLLPSARRPADGVIASTSISRWVCASHEAAKVWTASRWAWASTEWKVQRPKKTNTPVSAWQIKCQIVHRKHNIAILISMMSLENGLKC